MSIANFPSLSPDEFTEACHHLESRYCHAKLGSERARWKLKVCTALCTDFSFEGGYTTYIQIRRPLQTDLDHGDLSLDLENFSFSDEKNHDVPGGDRDMMDAEEADEVINPRWSFVFLLRPLSYDIPGRYCEAPISPRCWPGGIRDSSSSYVSRALSVVHFAQSAPR